MKVILALSLAASSVVFAAGVHVGDTRPQPGDPDFDPQSSLYSHNNDDEGRRRKLEVRGTMGGAWDHRELTNAQRRLLAGAASGKKIKAVVGNVEKAQLKAKNLRGVVSPERRLIGEPFTAETLQVAVGAYCEDAASAEAIYGDINSWDVSGVTSLRGLFMPTDWEGHCSTARTFNANISSWDVSSVKDMEETFSGAWAFTGDLSGWNVKNVRNFRYCFDHAIAFDSDVSQWDVSGAHFMDGMFSGAFKFNRDVSGWDVSEVESFKYLFEYTTHFNQDLSAWNVHEGSDFKSMFEYATAFDQKLCWALPENAIADRMFDGCKGSLTSDC